MADIFEKWQPDPRVVTAVKTSVENVESVRAWLNKIYGVPVRESVSYLKGNEIVIDWDIRYRENFSVRVGDYLVLDANDEIRIYDNKTFNKEFARITSAVSLESEEGKCKACGQDILYFRGRVWHAYTERLCPGLMRSVPIADIFTPKSKEQDNG